MARRGPYFELYCKRCSWWITRQASRVGEEKSKALRSCQLGVLTVRRALRLNGRGDGIHKLGWHCRDSLRTIHRIGLELDEI